MPDPVHPFPSHSPSLANVDIRAPERLRLSQIPDWKWRRFAFLVVGDVLGLALAWKLAGGLNRKFFLPIPGPLVWFDFLGLPSLFWLLAIATVLAFTLAGLYNRARIWRDYLQAGKWVSYMYLLSLVLGYFYDPTLDPPRSLFFTAWFLSVGFVVLFRMAGTLFLRQFAQNERQVRVFLLAPAHRLNKLAKMLADQPHCEIVGAALSATANSSATLKAMLNSGAQEVLAAGLPQMELASALYWNLQRAGITLRLIPSSLEILHHRGRPEIFAGLPTLHLEAPLIGGWEYRLKRGLDFCVAALGILLLSPLFLGVAIAIKLTSPGAVFFRQERMGLHGKVFQMWKFRTMVADAPLLQAKLEAQNDSKDGVLFKIKQDPRITPIGYWLRRTSADELPQLFNVLMGQMSLVGPRPLPLRDVQRFDPWHHVRHQVLPGITGLWQISGRSDIQEFDDAARLDLYYIDNWSLNLDLEILVETVRIVLFSQGAY